MTTLSEKAAIIVEDSIQHSNYFKEILKKRGFTIIIILQSLEKALKYVEEELLNSPLPWVILLDAKLGIHMGEGELVAIAIGEKLSDVDKNHRPVLIRVGTFPELQKGYTELSPGKEGDSSFYTAINIAEDMIKARNKN